MLNEYIATVREAQRREQIATRLRRRTGTAPPARRSRGTPRGGPGATVFAATITSKAVCLRPLERGDTETVLEVFAGLGPRSRELRFLAAKPRLTDADVRQLADVDDRDHVAVVARSDHDDHPVGIARFVREPSAPDTADVAVAVVDAWQGRGVGTTLLDALLGRAAELGVRRLTLVTAPDNRAVLRLLGRAPGAVSRVGTGRGATEYAVSLDKVER